MPRPRSTASAFSAACVALAYLPALVYGGCIKMPIYTHLPRSLKEVDVIIAGGGTAGNIIASRLSDADPDLSILVIERGQNNWQNPGIIHPALFLGALMPGSTTAVTYLGTKEPALADRQLAVPVGGVLGGGSSINIMMYSRAQRHDFNSWDAPGWSADEILPFMKKLETFYGSNGTAGRHGTSGPIQISRGTYSAKRAEDDFISAAARLGWPEKADLQDLDTCNGTQRAMRYVGPDGRRQDTAHAYLHPRTRDGKHPNLHVLVEHQVVKVLFDKKKAVGVEFRPNPLFQDEQLTQTVKARKLVILSAGTLGSPSILERSGVGHPDVLTKAGVQTVAALPGVGNNYQDHHLVSYSYRTTLYPNETVDGIITGRVDTAELIATNSSILGWNAQDVTCKLRPSAADIAALGPDFQAAWDKDFKSHPDKPLILMAPINGFPGDPSTVPVGQYFSLSTFSVYPYSRGSFHINGPSIDDGVSFTTGFFADAKGLDVKKHIWAYKTQREIMRRMKTYRGEVESTHPAFAANSAARPVILDAPLPDSAPNIVYTAEDDAAIEKYVRGAVGTTWHSLGTCKMAPLAKGGVVDNNLSVYGVERLKVADLSIPPENVAANTANTAMTIGEKAADVFIKELKL